MSTLQDASSFDQSDLLSFQEAMESDLVPRTQDPPLIQPSFKNRSHVSHKLTAELDHSPRPLILTEGSRPRTGTPILRVPTPLSSFENSFPSFGFDTKRSRTATPILRPTTPIPKSATPVPQTASTNHLEAIPDFDAPVTPARASLNYSQQPSSRAPSATPQRPRKRKRDLFRKLFYPLLGVFLTFLLVIPITFVLLIQAAVNGSLLVPYLIPFLLITGFAIATGAGTAALWSKRRQRRKQKTKKDAIEIEKWKTLAREKSREVEIVGWAAERLRGGLRSLSRSRAASEGGKVSESGKGVEAGERARSKDARPRQDSKARVKRSVSRGRTGRAKAREEVWVSRGPAMSDTASLQPKVKGSVARARAAVSDMSETASLQPQAKGSVARAREAVSAIKERREATMFEIRVTQPTKPTSIKSTAMTRRRADTNKPLPPLPLQPSGESNRRWGDSVTVASSIQQRKPSNPLPLQPSGDSAQRWGDSMTITSPIQQRRPSNPLLQELLQPSDSTDGGPTPLGFRPTIIDQDVLAEIQKQIIERSRSRAAKNRAKETGVKEPEASTKPVEVKKAEGKEVATEGGKWTPTRHPRGLDIMDQVDSKDWGYDLQQQIIDRDRSRAAKDRAAEERAAEDRAEEDRRKLIRAKEAEKPARAAKEKRSRDKKSKDKKDKGKKDKRKKERVTRYETTDIVTPAGWMTTRHLSRGLDKIAQHHESLDDYDIQRDIRRARAAQDSARQIWANVPELSTSELPTTVNEMVEYMRIQDLRRMEAERYQASYRPEYRPEYRPDYRPGPLDLMGQPVEFEFDYEGDEDGDEDNHDGGDELEQASHTSHDSPESPLEIMRGGHGGMGSSQSDDNFETSHALDEDAVSMSSSIREAKRADSLHKVAMWASRSELAIAGVSDVSPKVEGEGGSEEKLDGSGDSRGESTRGLPASRSVSARRLQRDTSRSTHDMRRGESARRFHRNTSCSRGPPDSRGESARGLGRDTSRSTHDIKGESARRLQRDASRSDPHISGESTKRLQRDTSRSIHDIRQKFDEWVDEKRARSRGRAWTITGR